MIEITYLFKFPVLSAPAASPSLSSRRSALFATSCRVGSPGSKVLLGDLCVLLHVVPQLSVELGSQLLVLIVQGANAVNENPVIPGVLPALVVDSVAETISRLVAGRLDVHDLGFVEHVHVEAQDLFVLLKLRLLLARGRHDGDASVM